MMEPMKKKETTTAVSFDAASAVNNSEPPEKGAMLRALSVLAMFHVPMRTCRIVTAVAADDGVSVDLAAPAAAVRRFWQEGRAEAEVTDKGVADAMCAYAYVAKSLVRQGGTMPEKTADRPQAGREAPESAMACSDFVWELLFHDDGPEVFDRRVRWRIRAAPEVPGEVLETAAAFLTALGLPVTKIRREKDNVLYEVRGERFRRVMTAFAAYTTGLFVVERLGTDEGRFAAPDDTVNPLEAYFEPSFMSGRPRRMSGGRDRFSVRLTPLGRSLLKAAVQ